MLPTTDQMLASLEADRLAAQRRADAAHRRMRAMVELARSQGRDFLSPAESDQIDRLMGERDRARRQLEGLAPQISTWQAARAEDQADAARHAQIAPTNVPQPSHGRRPASFSITREERTYRPDQDPNGSRFLLDVARSYLHHDPGAVDRLARHQREEEVLRPAYAQRSIGTGNLAGLVVPQYLTDMFAPAARAMRPFAEVCNHHDLPPDGMTVNIPLLTTPSQVALQTAENTAGTSTNPTDTLLTENVQTATGNVTISRQAIDRGTGVEDLLMQDLFNAYATNLDDTLINQATTGLSALASPTTYTSASPTITEFWPYIFQAGSQVERNLLQIARVSHVVMSIARWNWLTSGLSTSWPFVGSALSGDVPARQAGVSVTDEYGPAVRGRMANGWLVCVDGNVKANYGAGTNQDEVYVVPSREFHLWEDPDAPAYIRADQPAAASLGVLLVVYGYFAYSGRRYTSAMGKISGTGLVVPAGF